MTGAELLALLKPMAKDAKYSDNLIKWLKKHKSWPLYVVFSRHSHIDGSEVEYNKDVAQAHHIIICIGENDGFDTGSRLSQIIGKGASADRFCYSTKQFKNVPFPNWFESYIEGGKCFIDPQHRLYLSDERWITGKRTRKCKWCGYLQEKITKRKTYHIWQ